MTALLFSTEGVNDIMQDRAVADPVKKQAADLIEGAGYDAPYVQEKNLEVDLRPDAEPAPITDESLITNPLWTDASRRMMKMFRSTNAVGQMKRHAPKPNEAMSDEEAAQWGLEFMGWFNYNLPYMGMTAHQVSNSPGGDKLALYYMMNLYDQKKISWDGTKRMFKGIFSDPTTYVGLSTMGVGAAAGFGAKQAGKKGLLAALKAGMPAALLTGLEGGVYTSIDDALRQSVEIGASAQEGFDVGRNLTAAGVGTVAGTTLGAGASVAPELVRRGVGMFEDTVQAARRGTMFSGAGPVDDDAFRRAEIARDEAILQQGGAPGELSYDAPLEGLLYKEPAMPDFQQGVDQMRLLSNEDLTAQRKGGLLPFLHETAVPEAPIGGFVKKINQKNADKVFASLDQAAVLHPDPASSPEAWVAYQADLMGKKPGEETAVSLPPYQLIRYKNNPDDLTGVMSHLTPDQAGMAKSGLDMSEQIGQSYAKGEMTTEDTAELLMWGMFSRQKSAYPHEAAFIDMVTHVDDQGRSLRTFVDKAAAGQYTQADIADYLAWAKTAMPAGTPGRAAIDNINAFGKHMLPVLSRDAGGESVLTHMHNMISDPNKTGREIRREFFKLAEGSGIDNKVLSFVLLLTGRKDVMVLDRIQFNHMWNDGRFGDYNLYTPISKLNPDGTPALTPKGKPQMMSGSTISDIGKNAYGLMVYEAMERELEKILPDVYAKLGREYRGIGQFHWESWVLTSQQEAAHPSVTSFVERTNPNPQAPHASIEVGTFSREGRFDAYAYGAEYGKKADGSRIIRYPNSKGEFYEFTPDQFQKFLKDVKKPKEGVIYPGFKVEDFGTGTVPWVRDERIDRGKLDALIKRESSGPV